MLSHKYLKNIDQKLDALSAKMEASNFLEYVEYASDRKRMLKTSFLIGLARGIGIAIGFSILGALVIYLLRNIAHSSLPGIADFIAKLIEIIDSKR